MSGGRSSQAKGRSAELELCRILQDEGFTVEPGQAVSYGSTPDLTGLPGVHIECKRCERLAIPAWLRQAQADAERFGDGLPAVFFRQNRQGWAVVMALPDWVSLYRNSNKCSNLEGSNENVLHQSEDRPQRQP